MFLFISKNSFSSKIFNEDNHKFLQAIEFYSTGLFTQFPNKKTRQFLNNNSQHKMKHWNHEFVYLTHSIKWNIGIMNLSISFNLLAKSIINIYISKQTVLLFSWNCEYSKWENHAFVEFLLSFSIVVLLVKQK